MLTRHISGINIDTAEQFAKMFHEQYERLAPEFNYRTRRASRVPWDDVPTENKELMIAVCQALIDDGYLPEKMVDK